MRKVFTSPRLENVEAVAAMLRAEDIEVRITNDRSYRGNRRSTFSYRQQEQAAPEPSVWIVNSDQQPRARQLLREAGLLESSRDGASSYLPLSVLDATPDPQAKSKRRLKIRLGLLALVLAVLGLTYFGTRTPAPAVPPVATPQPAPLPADIVPRSAEELQAYRADVPTALARLLVEDAVTARQPTRACVAIDGRDPSPDFLQSLGGSDAALSAATACPADALRIAVRDYTTDGSGIGKVAVQLDDEAARTLDVERDGAVWRVLARN